jgi:glycosyltransferase involved in cell wall biosynthesis
MRKLRPALESVSVLDSNTPKARISVIVPAMNEAEAIGEVVRGFTGGLVRECIVVDNGSTDATAERAWDAGARVVSEPRPGYGQACAAGVAAADPASDILVFVDGDGSDVADDLPAIAGPVLHGAYDFVIGSRIRGEREAGSLLLSQLIAGWMAGVLIRMRYGVRYTDMGPFRAISREALNRMSMSETTYGWNLEMQMKAAIHHLRILEVPASYRRRQGGVSKVAGSLSGSLKAAVRIIRVFLRISFLG